MDVEKLSLTIVSKFLNYHLHKKRHPVDRRGNVMQGTSVNDLWCDEWYEGQMVMFLAKDSAFKTLLFLLAH